MLTNGEAMTFFRNFLIKKLNIYSIKIPITAIAALAIFVPGPKMAATPDL